MAARHCCPRLAPGTGGRRFGGDRGIRTPDLSSANAALSQLSYVPTNALGRLHRMERPERESIVLLRRLG